MNPTPAEIKRALLTAVQARHYLRRSEEDPAYTAIVDEALQTIIGLLAAERKREPLRGPTPEVFPTRAEFARSFEEPVRS